MRNLFVIALGLILNTRDNDDCRLDRGLPDFDFPAVVVGNLCC